MLLVLLQIGSHRQGGMEQLNHISINPLEAQCIGAIDVARARVPAGACSVIFLLGVSTLQYTPMPTLYRQRSGAVGNVLGPGPKGPWVGATLLDLQERC